MTAPDQLTFGKVLFLVAGLAGSLLINRSAQFTSINATDIQSHSFQLGQRHSWDANGGVGIAVPPPSRSPRRSINEPNIIASKPSFSPKRPFLF